MKQCKLYIVDSVSAARALLTQIEFNADAYEIFTTHYSVVDFLATYGIRAQDCSALLSCDDVKDHLQRTSRDLDLILNKLDSTLGVRICLKAGLPTMRVFHPLYKYLGQYHLAGLRAFKNFFELRLSEGDISCVCYYYALSNSNHPIFSFEAMAKQICKANLVAFESVYVIPSFGRCFLTKINRFLTLVSRGLRSPRKTAILLLRGWNRFHQCSVRLFKDRPIAFVFDPPQCSFFVNFLSQYKVQIIRVPGCGIIPVKNIAIQKVLTNFDEIKAELIFWQKNTSTSSSTIDDIEHLIVSNLLAQASFLLLPLLYVNLIIRSYPLCLAAWDIPLVTRPVLNLIAEFFIVRKFPVFGRQHGANYVCQDCGSIHFDSDFDRCTHFFSYGFGQQEFQRTYPNVQSKCIFIPTGWVTNLAKSRAKPVDIVFPISNALSLFLLARLPGNELAERQLHILRAMELRRDLYCVVKPFVNFNENNFAHIETLKTLKNIKVEEVDWLSYLKTHRPRLIVFEIASTPLFEAIALDVDIFLMLDSVFPFSETALDMLKKRVHIFSSVEELSESIQSYGIKKLTCLRNEEFYRTYVNRSVPHSTVDNLMNTIVRF